MTYPIIDQTNFTKQERAVYAAEAFCNAVNEMSFDAARFAEQIRCSHRSLQQNTMRVVVELLKQWADDADNGNFDLRNEDTVKLAKAFLDAVEHTHLSRV